MTAEEKRERERQKRAAEISRVTSIYYQGALSAEEEKKQIYFFRYGHREH